MSINPTGKETESATIGESNHWSHPDHQQKLPTIAVLDTEGGPNGSADDPDILVIPRTGRFGIIYLTQHY